MIFKKKKQPRKKFQQTLNTYRLLPPTYRVKLRHRTYDTSAAVASPLFTRIGFLEFLNVLPTYNAALFSMYQRCRVHGSRITLTLINMIAEPIEMVAAVLPANWITGTPTLNELRDKPYSSRKIVSGVGGMDRATLVMSKTSAQVLGSASYLSDFDFDATQAASATPIQADEPAWIYALSSISTTIVISYRIEISVEWDCEFFDQTAT